MINDSKNKRVEDVAKKIREDGNININREHLMKDYQRWLDFDYEDWIRVLDNIKNDPLKLYAFIPFACTILGIEILHEFKELEGVEKSVRDYVGNGDGFWMYSLYEDDLRFYIENRAVVDLAFKSIQKLERQGAIPIKEYTLYSRKRVASSIKRYRKTIKREDFTTISLEDIQQEEYLFSERKIKNK